MDPVSISGIAGTAAGLFSLGITIASGLYQVASGIGSAGQEVRSYAAEIQTFSKLLNTVQKELQSTETAPADIQGVLRDVFELCDRVLQPLNNIQNTLIPLLDKFKDSPGKLRQLGQRVKYFFTVKDKLLFYRAALGCQHKILDTVLITLNHQATTQNTQLLQLMVKNHATPLHFSHRNRQQMGGQNSIESSHHPFAADGVLPPSSTTIIGLLEERRDSLESPAPNPTSDAQKTSHGAEAKPSVDDETAPSETDGTEPSGENQRAPLVGDQGRAPKISKALIKLPVALIDEEEEFDEEFLIIDRKLESDLATESPESATDIREDTRALERRVLRILEAVSQATTKPDLQLRTKSDIAKVVQPKEEDEFSEYTIGLICPGSLESFAMRAFLDEEHERVSGRSPGDTTQYTLGNIGNHKVVIAPLLDEDINLASAAVAAFTMQASFPKITMGLLVETGGAGSPYDMRLGDVVVSSPAYGLGGVFQYDYGRKDFQQLGFLNQPPATLLRAARTLRDRYDEEGHAIPREIQRVYDELEQSSIQRGMRERLQMPNRATDQTFDASYLHPNPTKWCEECVTDFIVDRPFRETDDSIKIYHGLVASGNLKLNDAELRDRLSEERYALCFEEAAAGVMKYLPCLVICGISNYADSHFQRGWRGYAAMTAAAYARELLRELPA